MTTSPSPALTAGALLTAAVATVAVGVYGGRRSRTTSDFLVASRSVGPQWNAAAISGEYLSAASFLGVAGLVSLGTGVALLVTRKKSPGGRKYAIQPYGGPLGAGAVLRLGF